MAACGNGVSRLFFISDFHPMKTFLQEKSIVKNCFRKTHFFKHLGREKEHNETDYEYEISKDPNEWKYVEKLLPFETVPVPKTKSEYPSEWAPMKEEAFKHPYFVERTKNHMLPVYFSRKHLSMEIVTKLSKIHGDLWGLHNDLHAHLEKITNQKICSVVQEGNNTIQFKGDFVYFVEQWLLSKGF